MKRTKIYDYKGLKICRICGMSFRSLQIHLGRLHKIDIYEYCKMFNIEHQTNNLKNKLHETETHKKKRVAKLRVADRQSRACKILKRLKPKIRGGDK